MLEVLGVKPLPPIEEQWAPIPGYDGRYIISTKGRVKTQRNGQLLKHRPNGSGYMRVILTDGREARPRFVHHLMAEVWIGPKPDGAEVRFKDGDRTNLHYLNIEYRT